MYALTARHNSEAPAPPDFVHQGGGEIATDALAEHHDPPPISLDQSQGPSTAALGTREHPRLGSGRSPSAPARLTARIQRPGRTRVTVIHRDQNLLLNFWNFVSQYFRLPSTQPREARIDEDGRLALPVGEDRGDVGPRDWIMAALHRDWAR